MGLIQHLERTAAEQFAAFPGGPKRNTRLAQFLKVKGVNTFRRECSVMLWRCLRKRA
jgi:hypothetical protein